MLEELGAADDDGDASRPSGMRRPLKSSLTDRVTFESARAPPRVAFGGVEPACWSGAWPGDVAWRRRSSLRAAAMSVVDGRGVRVDAESGRD